MLPPDRFPFVRHLEAHTDLVLEELARIRLEDFRLWPLEQAYHGGWRLFCLHSRDPDWLFAADCEANAARCPRTAGLIRSIPGALLGGFSQLDPGTHVYPHRDQLDQDCVRCHLTLRADGEAAIRFTDRVHRYEPGRCVVFHGETQHESVNLGREPRVVLLVDVALAEIESPVPGA